MFQKECIKSKAEFEQTFVGCTSNTCQEEGKYNRKKRDKPVSRHYPGTMVCVYQ